MKPDIYQRITHQIVAAIEEGAGQYRMPWHRPQGVGTPTNAVSGRAYRGINTLLLWAEASRAGYGSGEWATYRQWTQRGAQVRKGERSTLVILWKPLTATGSNGKEGDDRTRGRMLARAFRVFNADQVEGYDPGMAPTLPRSARIGRAESFFQRQPAAIWHGSDSAFYDPRADIVSMPSFESFISPEAFYSVLAHELTHWTGAKARLDRDLSGRFGSEAYAMEELVAELGAAFTVGHLNLACEPRTDHAPYIASWLRVLGNDPRAIVTAASRAQAAADYLVALSAKGASPKDASTSPRSAAQMEVVA
jgi:antirestriction protein ArdC